MVEKISPEAEAAYQRIHASDEFRSLKKAYTGFIVPATIAFMVWYVLYVLASNWAPDFMGTRLFGNINVALVFGLLQFVTTFGIAYAYSRYSISRLDAGATALREQFEKEIER